MSRYPWAAAFLAVAFLISPDVAFGQESPKSPSLEELKNLPKAVDNGSIKVYDAKIVSQDGVRIRAGFDLFNNDQVQPQIKYSVSLTRKFGMLNEVIDKKAYVDMISLGTKETVHREIEYAAPEYLSGEFELWLNVSNQNSYPLGMATLGKISLDGNGAFVEMVSDTCYLTIAGEEGKRYNMIEGVDVAGTEGLIAHCDLLNNFSKAVNIRPTLETYWRTVQGRLVATESGEWLSLAAGEKESFSYKIPLVQQPQAYDAVLTFTDESGKTVSNQTIFHYVLQGVSATVQNLRLDKDYYSKGEAATLLLYWTPSADISPYSRLKGGSRIDSLGLEVSIKSSAGRACSETYRAQEKDYQKGEKLSISITADCADPVTTVVLKDVQGKILDQSAFEVVTKSIKSTQEAKTAESDQVSWFGKKMAYLLAGIPLIILLVFLIFRKSGRGGSANAALLLFLCAFGLFLSGEKAQAWDVSGEVDGGPVSASFTTTLNKSVYSPGENIHVDGSGTGGLCVNGWSGIVLVGYDPVTGAQTPICSVAGELNWRQVNCSNHVNFTAPTVPGDYTITFGGAANVLWGSHVENFSVFDPKCTGTRCDGASVTIASGLSVCGSDMRIYKCNGNNNWSTDNVGCSCSTPEVRVDCSGSVGQMPVADISWVSNGVIRGDGTRWYQVRVDDDPDMNLIDSDASDPTGFWYEEINSNTTVIQDAPKNFARYGAAASPNKLVDGRTYYARIYYGQYAMFGPDVSFVATCPVCTGTVNPDPAGNAKRCSSADFGDAEDEKDLSGNVPYSLSISGSCTANKCEYACPSGTQHFSNCTMFENEPCCQVPNPCDPRCEYVSDCTETCGGGTKNRQCYGLNQSNECVQGAPYSVPCNTQRCEGGYREVQP